jgi:cellulose 1,4-beta-cellobiosidase
LFVAAPTRAIPTGSMQANNLLPFSITVDGQTAATQLAVDANWRWCRQGTSTTNCFAGGWVAQYCPNNAACTANCVLEGIPQSQWAVPYGLSLPASNAVKLSYVTVGPYGTNYGNRLYLANSQGTGYESLMLLGKEFRFTVDVSHLDCGINGALYLVSMDTANPQASFGTGYGDAQCPQDLIVVNNQFNTNKTGVCAPEIDLWEANKWATQFTPHSCSVSTATACSTAQTCGTGSNRYSALCDKDGADWNPYRNGQKTFYGPGSTFTVDTTKPVTVITRFHTAPDGSLAVIERAYEVNGAEVFSFNQTDATIAAQKTAFGEQNAFAARGGFASLTTAMSKGMVLVLSLWDDGAANMLWLDSSYGGGAGALRGPCPTSSGVPATTRAQYPSDYVIYSDIQVAAISGSSPSPSPTPTPPSPTPSGKTCTCSCTCPCPSPSPSPTPPSPTPTPTPSSCVAHWGQCGGSGATQTNCCAPYTCRVQNPFYSQCCTAGTGTC